MAVELFEPYPVTGGEIRAAANDTRSRIESIRDLRDQLEGAGRDPLAAVEGDLEGSVANAPTEAVTAGDMTIRDAEYAAGCLEYFAQAVDDFNTGRTSDPRSVQALNQAYAEAYDSGFGVSYSMVDDTSLQTFETTHQRYSQPLGHARQAVMGALIREHSRSQDLLEQAAEDVSNHRDRLGQLGPESQRWWIRHRPGKRQFRRRLRQRGRGLCRGHLRRTERR